MMIDHEKQKRQSKDSKERRNRKKDKKRSDTYEMYDHIVHTILQIKHKSGSNYAIQNAGIVSAYGIIAFEDSDIYEMTCLIKNEDGNLKTHPVPSYHCGAMRTMREYLQRK